MILVLCICLSLVGCKSAAVRKTEKMIDEIGEVSLERAQVITVAMESYAALTEEEKEEVENFELLEESLKELTVLENVAAVEAAIDAIGTVTAESQDLISAANSAYDALTEEEKDMVQNVDVLTAAMITYMEVASRWEIQHYVDEFGDETENGYLVGTFTGEFSNTATTNSDLTVFVYMLPETYSSGYMIAFRLAEYGDHIATYSKYDLLNLSFKIDGETYGVELMGTTPNGDLYLTSHYAYEDDTLAAHNKTNRATAYNAFFNALKDNTGEISCLITIGDMNNIITSVGGSTYRFKLNGNGLAEKLAELEN